MHALAFPDITVHELVLAPDAPHQIVIDRIELRDVPRAIEQVLTFHEGSRDGRSAPGDHGADVLRDTLAPQQTIAVPLAADFLEEEKAIIKLTHSQSALLGQFGRDRRMVVTGCAGWGRPSWPSSRPGDEPPPGDGPTSASTGACAIICATARAPQG